MTRTKRFERSLKRVESLLNLSTIRLKRKDVGDAQRRQTIQATKVEDARKDIEADRGQDREEVGQEADTVTGRRKEETDQEAQTEKTENWTQARARKENSKNLCRKSSSGSGRRKRGTSTKVLDRLLEKGSRDKSFEKLKMKKKLYFVEKAFLIKSFWI